MFEKEFIIISWLASESFVDSFNINLHVDFAFIS